MSTLDDFYLKHCGLSASELQMWKLCRAGEEVAGYFRRGRPFGALSDTQIGAAWKIVLRDYVREPTGLNRNLLADVETEFELRDLPDPTAIDPKNWAIAQRHLKRELEACLAANPGYIRTLGDAWREANRQPKN